MKTLRESFKFFIALILAFTLVIILTPLSQDIFAARVVFDIPTNPTTNGSLSSQSYTKIATDTVFLDSKYAFSPSFTTSTTAEFVRNGVSQGLQTGNVTISSSDVTDALDTYVYFTNVGFVNGETINMRVVPIQLGGSSFTMHTQASNSFGPGTVTNASKSYPPVLEYQFETADGTPIELSGHFVFNDIDFSEWVGFLKGYGLADTWVTSGNNLLAIELPEDGPIASAAHARSSGGVGESNLVGNYSVVFTFESVSKVAAVLSVAISTLGFVNVFPINFEVAAPTLTADKTDVSSETAEYNAIQYISSRTSSNTFSVFDLNTDIDPLLDIVSAKVINASTGADVSNQFTITTDSDANTVSAAASSSFLSSLNNYSTYYSLVTTVKLKEGLTIDDYKDYFSEGLITIPNTASVTIDDEVKTTNTVNIQFDVGYEPGVLAAAYSIDKSEAKLGDVLTHTITLSNTADYSMLESIDVSGILPEGLILVPDSLKVDGVDTENGGTGESIQTKVRNIGADDQLIVSFQSKVVSKQDEIIQSEITAANDADTEQTHTPVATVQVIDSPTALINSLDEKAQDAIDTINGMEYLTDQQKSDRIQEIEDALVTAKDNVEAGTDLSDVETAVSNGINEFDRIVNEASLDDEKAKAILDLEAKAVQTNENIDALSDVSDAEKNEAKAQVEQVLQDAIAGVNRATDSSEVANARDEGYRKMDEIYDNLKAIHDSRVKDARDLIQVDLNTKAEEAKAKVDALENLSDADKQEAKAVIDARLEKALEDLGQADSIAALQPIADDASFDFDKEVARSELRDKAVEVRDRSEELRELNPEQRDQLHQEINDTLQEWLDKVDETTTVAELDTTTVDGKAALEGIHTKYQEIDQENLDKAKDDAAKQLEDAAQKAKDEIDKLENLTDEEKQAYKDEIDKALEDAKSRLENAESSDEIETIVNDNALDNAKIIEKAKLDDAAEKAKNDVDQLEYLSDEEKQAYKNEIDQKASDAKAKIDDSQTGAAVNDAADQGLLEIEKTVGSAQLDDYAEKGKQAIDNLPYLSDAEKYAYKDAIDEAVEGAKQKIQDAQSVSQISDIISEGVREIDHVSEAAQIKNAKNGAIEELRKAAESEKVRIDALDITDAQKQEGKARIDAILNQAILDINSATNIDDVTTIKNEALNAMNIVFVELSLLPPTGVGSYSLLQIAMALSLAGVGVWFSGHRKKRLGSH